MKKTHIFGFAFLATFIFLAPLNLDKLGKENSNIDERVSATTATPTKYNVESYEANGESGLAVVTGGTTTNENIYSWGTNSKGELGTGGSLSEYNTPQLITDDSYLITSDYSVQDIEVGEEHMAALIASDTDQYLYMWGSNQYHQISQSNTFEYKLPALVWSTKSSSYDMLDIELGTYSSSAVVTDGANDYLYTWGTNINGILGIGSLDESKSTGPTLVTALPIGEEITEIAMGENHAGAITHNSIDDKDHLYMWGNNESGQLGLGTPSTGISSAPLNVTYFETGFSSLSNLAVGLNHTGIIADNKLYLWGDNGFGQIGLEMASNYMATPTEVIIPDVSTYEQLSLGDNHTGVLIEDISGNDKLYSLGNNNHGELGNGELTNNYVPQDITDSLIYNDNDSYQINSISYGGNQSSAIISQTNSTKLYTWGENEAGQLGNGNNFDSYKPKNTYLIPTYFLTNGDLKRRGVTTNSYALEVQIYDPNKMLEDVINSGNTDIALTGDFETMNSESDEEMTIQVYDETMPRYNENSGIWSLDYLIQDLYTNEESTVTATQGLAMDVNQFNESQAFVGTIGNPYVLNDNSNSLWIVEEGKNYVEFAIIVYDYSNIFENHSKLEVTLGMDGDTELFTAYNVSMIDNSNGTRTYFYRIDDLRANDYQLFAIRNPFLTEDSETNNPGQIIYFSEHHYEFAIINDSNAWIIILSIILAISIIFLMITIYLYNKQGKEKKSSSKKEAVESK